MLDGFRSVRYITSLLSFKGNLDNRPCPGVAAVSTKMESPGYSLIYVPLAAAENEGSVDVWPKG